MSSVLEFAKRMIKSKQVVILNRVAAVMAVVLVGSSTLVDGKLQVAAIVVGLLNGFMWAKTRKQ